MELFGGLEDMRICGHMPGDVSFAVFLASPFMFKQGVSKNVFCIGCFRFTFFVLLRFQRELGRSGDWEWELRPHYARPLAMVIWGPRAELSFHFLVLPFSPLPSNSPIIGEHLAWAKFRPLAKPPS